jgi:eukaryotic-like serine/threonine-protein kinase
MATCPSCRAEQAETNECCCECGAALRPEFSSTVTDGTGASCADNSVHTSLADNSCDERRESAAHDETVLYGAPHSSSTGVGPHDGNAVLVEGSSPHLSVEIKSVLRRRLQGAALVLFMGHVAFAIFMFLVDIPHYPTPPFLNAYHIFAVTFLAVCGGVLFRSGPIPLQRLRQLELLMFGVTAVNFVLVDYVSIMDCAPRGFVQSPAAYWTTLILLYGIFIPNTWRRAATVVSGMFVISLAMTVYLRFRYDFVAQALSWIQVIHWSMMELVGCAGAITGAHLISTLRKQVFEAKQLGQYRLKKLIGSGGMGDVYLGEHRLLKRPCAIKVIRPGKAADPLSLARFERETQITAQLSHPNTIEVFDHGRTEDGTFYYVMEYLPGLSLAQLVQRHGPLPAARIVYLLRQVCGALREAHGVGLIHRDIKPDNIFSAHRGGRHDVAKLLDFGLVKLKEDSQEPALTQDGTVAGTPSYMSPEQSMGDSEPDVRSDIYSLGAVAYFLLTGRPPFERDTLMKVLIAHVRDDVVPPSVIQSDVPDDLEKVVLQCLAKSCGERFQDAESLEAALARCESNGQWTEDLATRWWDESKQPLTDMVSDDTLAGGDSPAPENQYLRPLE